MSGEERRLTLGDGDDNDSDGNDEDLDKVLRLFLSSTTCISRQCLSQM